MTFSSYYASEYQSNNKNNVAAGSVIQGPLLTLARYL